MKVFTRVVLALLATLLCQPALGLPTSPTQKFNRDFITGQNYYGYWSGGSSVPFVSVTLTNTYQHSVQSPIAVYYTTKYFWKDVYNYPSPTNSSQKSIEYYLSPNGHTATTLTTTISGYLYYPQLDSLHFAYLIVLANNRIFGSHVMLQNIEFNKAIDEVYSLLPSSYTSGDDIRCYSMLRDMRMQLDTSDSLTYGVSVYAYNSLQTSTVLTQLSVPNYFGWPSSDYSFRYLVVIVDQTKLNNDYSGYKSQSSSIAVSYPSSSYYSSFNSDFSTNYQFNTFIGGYSHIQFQYDQFYYYFYLNFYAYHSANQYQTYCGYYCTVQFAYWITQYLECDGSQGIYINSLCYDSCAATNQYYNFATQRCELCPPICPTCSDLLSCRSCNSSQNRVLSNGSCVPRPGYYESGSPVAGACDPGCLTCYAAATNCTSCTNLSLLVGGVCRPCWQVWQGCQVCRLGTCLRCNSSYSQVNSTYCNLPCSAPQCDVCSNQNTSFCYHCTPNPLRQLINGECVPLCGNAIITGNKVCDDGNTQSHDGCSNECKHEPGYNCTTLLSPAGHNYTAYCSYLRPINFSLVSQQKLQGSNSLRFVLAVDKQQLQESFWKIYEREKYDSFVFVSAKHTNLKAGFLSQWSFGSRLMLQSSQLPPRAKDYQPQQLLQVLFQYQQQLHNKPLSLSFNFKRSRNARVSFIPHLNVTFNVIPQNNNYAHLYHPQTYQQQSIAKTVLTLQCVCLYICLLVAIIGKCKRIVAEAIMVAQICYAGLITIEWTNPLHSSVKSLSLLFNPLNIFFLNSYRPYDDPLLPNRLRGLGFYSNFMANFNTGLAFLALPVLVGAVLALLRCMPCFSEERKEKMSQYSKACFSEFLLAGVTMTGCVFGCSAVMELKYGISDLSYSGLLSLVVSGIVALLFAVSAILWLKGSSALFQEYRSILNTKKGLEIVFTLVYSYSGLIIAVLYFSLYSNKYVSAITMGYAVLGLLVLALCPIYAKAREKIRVQTNLATIVLTQSAYLTNCLWADYSYESVDSVLLKGTLVVPLAIAVNLLVNMSLLAYEIVKQVRQWLDSRKKKIAHQEQKQYLSQKSTQMVKIYQDTAPPIKAVFQTPLMKGQKLWEKDSSNYMLKEELNKFLQKELEQAGKVLSAVKPAPKMNFLLTDPKYHQMDAEHKNCNLDQPNQIIPEESLEDDYATPLSS